MRKSGSTREALNCLLEICRCYDVTTSALQKIDQAKLSGAIVYLALPEHLELERQAVFERAKNLSQALISEAYVKTMEQIAGTQAHECLKNLTDMSALSDLLEYLLK